MAISIVHEVEVITDLPRHHYARERLLTNRSRVIAQRLHHRSDVVVAHVLANLLGRLSQVGLGDGLSVAREEAFKKALAEEILFGELTDGGEVQVSIVNNEVKLSITGRKGAEGGGMKGSELKRRELSAES